MKLQNAKYEVHTNLPQWVYKIGFGIAIATHCGTEFCMHCTIIILCHAMQGQFYALHAWTP